MRSRAICVVAEGGTCGWGALGVGGVYVGEACVCGVYGREGKYKLVTCDRTHAGHICRRWGIPSQLMLVFPTTSAKELT